MAARKPQARPSFRERTPVAEWIAAAVGLVLTLGVIGYSLWEGLTADQALPSLTVEAGEPRVAGRGFVVPLVVKNASPTTAAAVEVKGVLEQAGAVVEERRAAFAYVPGHGEVRGGLVFERDPRAHSLRVAAEGYEEP